MGRYVDIGMIYFIMQANLFIYGLRKIALFKDIIPEQLQHIQRTKILFGIGGILLAIVKKIITVSGSILILSYLLPIVIFEFFGQIHTQTDLIIIFCATCCIVPAITQSTIFRLEKEDHMYLNYFKINPNIYYRYKITKMLFVNIIFTIPALYIIFEGNWVIIGILVVVKLATSTIGNLGFTLIYDKNKSIPKVWRRIWIGNIIILVTYGLLIFINPSIEFINKYIYSVISIGGMIITICSYRLLMKYSKYLGIARKYANKDVVALHVSVSTKPPEEMMALNVSDWKENLDYFNKNKAIKGIEYLNRAFIERHKKIINRFYRNRAILCLALGGLGGWIIQYKQIALDVNTILMYSSWMITFVLFFSFGRQFCQILFYHCDFYLLSHRMYKEKGEVYKGYLFRLKYLLKRTLITCLMIGIGLALMVVIGGVKIEINELIMLYIVGGSILMLYEGYHLLVYYIIQPYSSEATIENPLYKMLSWVELLIGVGFFIAKQNITYYSIPIFLLSILVIILGSVIVKKYGFKLFKLH